MFWGTNHALMYSSDGPIFKLSSHNYKNRHIKMLPSQKCGGSQKDTDMVGLYFGKCYLDSAINHFQKQKVEINDPARWL